MVSTVNQLPPPPPPIRPVTAATILPAPVQSPAAQSYRADWQPPASSSAQQGGIGGFIAGLGHAGDTLLHAGADLVTGATAAAAQVGGQVVRSGADIVAATTRAGVGSIAERVGATVSVATTGVRAALDVTGHVIADSASITGAVLKSGVDIGSHVLEGPGAVAAAAVRSGADVAAHVTAAGADLAATTARAGGQVAAADAVASAGVRAQDARGATEVASHLGSAVADVSKAAVRAGGTIAGHVEAVGDDLVQAGRDLGQTYYRAGVDVTSLGLRIGGAAIGKAQEIGHALVQPFNTTHQSNGPITPPGGLGAAVGGVGTPQDVYRDAMLARESYTNRTPNAPGDVPSGLPALPAGSRAVTDPGELAKLGLNRAMLSDPAVPGYQAQVYATQRPDGHTGYTVGFAGTDDLHDVATDARQAFGQDTGSYAKALEIGRAVATHPGVDVNFVGHSLGGGLAAEAAVASGRHADTFNAAGIHQTSLDRALASARETGVAPGTVDNYRVQGEVLTTISEVPAARGVVGGVLGAVVNGGAGFLAGGPLGAIAGAASGVPGGAVWGANLEIPAGYGRQHDTPFVPVEGKSGNIGNRHTMDFVLASVRSQLP